VPRRLFILTIQPPPSSTPFPYTTLFRSQLTKPASVRCDGPQLAAPVARDEKHDDRSRRGPFRHADRDRRILLERHLSGALAVGSCNPEVGMAATVREVGDLGFVRADGRRLHVSGLTGDANRAPGVFERRASDW